MNRTVLLSFVDQALISAFNLVLNLAFIAYASPSEFGRFVLVLAASFFLTSGQNALVVMPLNFLLPGRPVAERDGHLSMLTSANLALAAIALPLGVGLGLLIDAGPVLTLCILGYFLTIVVREYVRNLMVVSGRMGRTLVYDVSAIVASVVLILLLWNVLPPESAVLAGMAGGNFISFAFGRFDLKLDVHAFRAHLMAYGKVWRDTRWALQGALQNEVSKRSYAFFVERMRDAAALGTLNAGRVALSPLQLIPFAWARVARPRLVEELQAGRTSSISRMLWSGAALITGASVLYALALALAWPLIETFVFKNRYAGIEVIVICWWVHTLVVGIATVASTLMEARRQFRELAAVGLAGAIVIPVLVFVLLLANADAVSVVLALASMQIVELFVVLWFASRQPGTVAEAGRT
jgi:O-antigen/teichoic acid export membrane protein